MKNTIKTLSKILTVFLIMQIIFASKIVFAEGISWTKILNRSEKFIEDRKESRGCRGG